MEIITISDILSLQKTLHFSPNKTDKLFAVLKESCVRKRVSLGSFAKLRKLTISIALSVRLSVRMEQLGSHWTDFHEIWYLRIFSEICSEKSNFIKIRQG
jgi:hypothetical protein